jgi:hypothetical protein
MATPRSEAERMLGIRCSVAYDLAKALREEAVSLDSCAAEARSEYRRERYESDAHIMRVLSRIVERVNQRG